MRFVCRDFGLSDLPRRGLTPQEAPLEVLLLDIEAELSMWEQGQVVWREEQFPVAELAYHLALWLQSPAAAMRTSSLTRCRPRRGSSASRVPTMVGGSAPSSHRTSGPHPSPGMFSWQRSSSSTSPCARALPRWASSPPSSHSPDSRTGPTCRWNGHGVTGVITASESSWIAPFSGLSPRCFGKLVTAIRRESAADGRRGRPWGLPLEDRILLVAAYWRTNLTMRQIAPLFGVSKSAEDRIIDHLGPLLALQPRKRFRKDAVLIVDGTLVPTRDHTIAEQSKNYRYSTAHQVVIDADTRLVVVVGFPAGQPA